MTSSARSGSRSASSALKALALQKLQGELKPLDQEQRALLRCAFVASLDSILHVFLFAQTGFDLENEADRLGAKLTRDVEILRRAG